MNLCTTDVEAFFSRLFDLFHFTTLGFGLIYTCLLINKTYATSLENNCFRCLNYYFILLQGFGTFIFAISFAI